MSQIDHLYWEEEGREGHDGIRSGAPSAPPVTKEANRRYRWWLPECSHWRHPFELEGGLTVYASAWFDRPDRNPSSNPSGFSGSPDIGFYLDGAWAAESILTSPGYRPSFLSRKKVEGRIVLYPWRDWGVPEDPRQFRRALKCYSKMQRREWLLILDAWEGMAEPDRPSPVC